MVKKKLSKQQKKFKKAAEVCQTVMKKEILDNPTIRPLKAYGKCMKKKLTKKK